MAKLLYRKSTVSLLWRNELRVVLCPDQVILLGLGRGMRRKVILQTILPCAALPGAPVWQPALTVFEHWLQSNTIGRSDVTVLLSNHFVRYALMPFSEDVTSRAEVQALGQALLEGIYGELARQWRVQIGEGGYGEPRLVAAVDTLLLDRVVAMLRPGMLKLQAVAPHLVAAYNCFHDRIKESDGLFAVVETGQMMVIAFNSGQLSGVRRVPLNGALGEQIPGLLQREALTSGLDWATVPVYLHVVGNPDFKLPDDDRMRIHCLRHAAQAGTTLSADVRFDMAHAGGYA